MIRKHMVDDATWQRNQNQEAARIESRLWQLDREKEQLNTRITSLQQDAARIQRRIDQLQGKKP